MQDKPIISIVGTEYGFSECLNDKMKCIEMPEVSVIVPVYNAEKFLSDCIESVLAQTYSNWELILVDDGSNDGSGKLCDHYSNQDERIRVFHKENGGVSSARNLGLSVMNGKWVLFVDADDMLHPNTIEGCLRTVQVNGVDFLQFPLTSIFDLLGRKVFQDTAICTPQVYIDEVFCQGCAGGSFINAQIITENSLRFEEGMKLAEDQLFIFSCVCKAHSLQKIGEQYYYYRPNTQSATHTERSEDIQFSIEKCIDFKRSNPMISNRMDALGLYFIEKLALLKEINLCERYLRQLKPTYKKRSFITTRVMVSLSHLSIKLAVLFEIICLPLFMWVVRIIGYKK